MDLCFLEIRYLKIESKFYTKLCTVSFFVANVQGFADLIMTGVALYLVPAVDEYYSTKRKRAYV